ncbi:MAG TPA: CGNR zinc finger domain-containing protein [Streptosporangiaceae bacterium]|nr:CGNR zinc finger domain-containing protein [Streptosporangiaceae bacterium]
MRAGTTGRVLRDARGVCFRFDAGAVCLDFAHTGGEGRYAVFETLHEPADLGEWLAQPPLAAVLTVPPTTQELAAAKVLRQAIWDAAHARAASRPLPAEAVAAINRAAAAPPLTPELASSSAAVAPLTPGPAGVSAAAPPLAPGPAGVSAAAPPLAPGPAGVSLAAGWAAPVRVTQALSTLAREMIELLSGPFSGRIRECASGDCPLVFVDTSRPGARRWCAMERCGNRHKLRALRARRATDP